MKVQTTNEILKKKKTNILNNLYHDINLYYIKIIMDKRASTDLINTEMYVISPSKNVSSDSLDSDSKSSSLNSKHNNELVSSFLE